MEYYKLVAVTGLPGLFELVSSKKDGAIVRSLIDKTTKFASTRIHQFSHIESIEIYTTGDNVNLVEVFQAMEKDASELPDAKDEKAVKAYFEKVYGEIDFDRVYNSDMKKIVKWFDILKKNDIEIKLSEPENEEGDEQEADEAVAEVTPATKKAASKANSSEDTDTAEPATKKAPAKKKAAAKKQAE
ncbi:MAG TPA: DUF5606 domain-containing protein [Niabella sp.]|nr:DUF5606 domain-containing protein [Niabella sp.]HOZ96154.1 DUF5606 domain-containing protein [Niabella sp.]HQW13519.1 DUF5606 domain-containing protein [Niabella sp.]HQX18913.1 DUF5606 domain-containing protein [Niabella sp.]HQX41798.1 DUF5606 domain-containing protein [Niabella sp.]